jgi:predicted ATPase
LEKTEGTPFFMEEIVQELLEQGVLVCEGVETRHVASLPTDLHIPTTVQGVLAARIDRLAPEEKALLQQLAVIGREFPLSLIRQVIARSEDELYGLLASLQRKEFLYEQPAFPEVEYIFKHALTQEVAYNTVLQERRKAWHEQTAQAIEVLFHSRLQEHYSELAHHYSRSGNTEKAVEYLHLAGQQAVQRSANPEAISHLTTALDLLLTRPETPERAAQELTLHLAVGPALMAAQGWAAPAVEQHYTRARALCAQLGDSPHHFPVLWGLWLFHMNRGELRTTQVLVEECLQLAEQTDEAGSLLEAHFATGCTCLWRGEFVRARAELEQSVALYQPQHQALTPLYGGLNAQVVSLGVIAHGLWFLGYPEQARRRIYEAQQLAQKLSRPFDLAFALCWSAMLQLECGDGRVAQDRADVGVALASEHGFLGYTAWGTAMRGGALIVQERWGEGIAQIRQGLEAYPGDLLRTVYLTWLAAGYGGAGQVEEGLATVAEALRLVEKNDERFYEAELYRLKGQLTLEARGWRLETSPSSSQAPSLKPPASQEVALEAEGYFLKAIEVARRQQAKSLELRAVMSLSRLWQQQGKQQEAHALLADIYGWFTEGFDTKDLQEAKALSEALSY